MAVTADRVVVELELRDGQYLARVRNSERAFVSSQNKIAQSAEVTERRVRASSAGISSALRGAAAGIAAGVSVSAIANLADGYTRFTNQLKVAGNQGSELAAVQERLFGIAQKYGVELEAIGTLYGRNAASAKELNLSQEDQFKIVEATSAALKVSGQSSQAASGALLQLSQALGGTVVQATEYNSLIDGARPLLQAVASGSDRWAGSVAKLTADVKDGNVPVREFVGALLKGAPGVINQAADATLTLSGSFTILNNALGKYIGEANQSLSATERFSAGIKSVADNLDVIVPAITVIAGLFATRFAAGLITAGLASDGFITKSRAAAASMFADEQTKTAAVAAGTRARVAAYTAESIALRSQVDTGRNAAGQFVSRARSADALAVANKNLAASIGPATLATVRNMGAVQGLTVGARALGSGLLELAGGPIGVIILALSALVFAIKYANDNFSNMAKVKKLLEGQEKRTADALYEYEKAAIAAAEATGENVKAAREAVNIKRELAVRELNAAAAARETALAYAAQTAELAKLAAAEATRSGGTRTEGEAIGQLAYAGGAKSEAAGARSVADVAVAAAEKAQADYNDLQRRIRDGSLTGGGGGGGGGGGVGGGRGGSSSRSGPTAEQIRRRAEDVAADEARAIADASNDEDAIRRLERENDIRTRQRDIIDAGTEGLIERRTVERALTEATEAQSRIDAARIVGQDKLLKAQELERNIALAALDENTDWLKQLEREAELQQLIAANAGLYNDEETARAAAQSTLAEIELARAEASKRLLDSGDRENALTILRIAAVSDADKARVRDLEDQEEVLHRIALYTSKDGGNLSIPDATTRANNEVAGIRSADNDVAFREKGARAAESFISLIRADDIGAEIGNRFREAAFDGLQQILTGLFADIFKGQQSGGGGGIGSVISSLFSGGAKGGGASKALSKIGSSASSLFGFGGGRAIGGPVRAGFSYDVGEGGREKFVAPANGYIVPNMATANARSSGGGAMSVNINLEGANGDATIRRISKQAAMEGTAAAIAQSRADIADERRASRYRMGR